MARSGYLCRGHFLLSSILILSLSVTTLPSNTRDRTAWMQQARWGVMNHYLADWIARRDGTSMSVEKWNELIDNFDVEGLAQQLESVGAGYYLITIGQNSGYYLSPNATYNKYVGIQPSKCSRRDLVADLHEALQERRIRLVVYLPSGGPRLRSHCGRGASVAEGRL